MIGAPRAPTADGIWDARHVGTDARRVVTIRPASPDNASAVSRIYAESSNAAFEAYQPARVVTDELVARWAADLSSPRHDWWVAEAEGSAVGLAGVGPSRDPVGPRVGELDTIAVTPAMWRRGVGRRLMQVANARLDELDYDEAVLWTWRDYDPGYSFYRSLGWMLTDRSRDNEHQICFRRPRGQA